MHVSISSLVYAITTKSSIFLFLQFWTCSMHRVDSLVKYMQDWLGRRIFPISHTTALIAMHWTVRSSLVTMPLVYVLDRPRLLLQARLPVQVLSKVVQARVTYQPSKSCLLGMRTKSMQTKLMHRRVETLDTEGEWVQCDISASCTDKKNS